MFLSFCLGNYNAEDFTAEIRTLTWKLFKNILKFLEQLLLRLPLNSCHGHNKITLCLMKSNRRVPLLYILHKNLQQSQNLCRLVDTNPFSSFDITCKKLNLMWKTSGNVFLGNLVFCFPKVALDVCGRVTPIPFRIFVDHVIIFNSNPIQYLRRSSP